MGTTEESVLQQARRVARCAAVAVVDDAGARWCADDADGCATEDHYFEVGSLTKPLTALLLAEMSLNGEVALATPIGDVLPAGENARITMQQLATHTSGLPRLPGNLLAKAAATPADPYSLYDEGDLIEALNADVRGSSAPEYSNYGYMVLGLVLTKIAGATFDSLLRERIFQPLGMEEATSNPESIPSGLRVPGFDVDGRPVPHWTKLILGAGGVEASIRSMATFLRAQLQPSRTPLEIALELAQSQLDDEVLGWQRLASLRWHNGGTGGFTSFLAFDRATQRGVVVLSNVGGGAREIDRAGFGGLGITNPLLG